VPEIPHPGGAEKFAGKFLEVRSIFPHTIALAGRRLLAHSTTLFGFLWAGQARWIRGYSEAGA
jgi:hypothetical protein